MPMGAGGMPIGAGGMPKGGGTGGDIIDGGIGMFLPADFYSSWLGPREVDLRLNPTG